MLIVVIETEFYCTNHYKLLTFFIIFGLTIIPLTFFIKINLEILKTLLQYKLINKIQN